MTRDRFKTYAYAATASVALFIGLAALKWYFWDIVVQEAGESDRSMLFWGIPIAFIGVAAVAIGTSLAGFASRQLRRRPRD
ncbi:MAG: hypothetical protein ACN4GK_01685 [Acidimicrobiia bacterium]